MKRMSCVEAKYNQNQNKRNENMAEFQNHTYRLLSATVVKAWMIHSNSHTNANIFKAKDTFQKGKKIRENNGEKSVAKEKIEQECGGKNKVERCRIMQSIPRYAPSYSLAPGIRTPPIWKA